MNSLRFLIPTLLPIALFLAPLPAAALDDPAADNLLKNGNFEAGTANWELATFNGTGTMAIDPEQKRDDKATLRIDSKGDDMTFLRQLVAVKPNTQYRLTAYLKTKNIKDLHRGKSGAILLAGMTSYASAAFQGTRGWTKLTMDLNSREKTELPLGVSLGSYNSHVSGTIWVSDLKLVELGKAGGR